jgi:hypothetical protein
MQGTAITPREDQSKIFVTQHCPSYVQRRGYTDRISHLTTKNYPSLPAQQVHSTRFSPNRPVRQGRLVTIVRNDIAPVPRSVSQRHRQLTASKLTRNLQGESRSVATHRACGCSDTPGKTSPSLDACTAAVRIKSRIGSERRSLAIISLALCFELHGRCRFGLLEGMRTRRLPCQ